MLTLVDVFCHCENSFPHDALSLSVSGRSSFRLIKLPSHLSRLLRSFSPHHSYLAFPIGSVGILILKDLGAI